MRRAQLQSAPFPRPLCRFNACAFPCVHTRSAEAPRSSLAFCQLCVRSARRERARADTRCAFVRTVQSLHVPRRTTRTFCVYRSTSACATVRSAEICTVCFLRFRLILAIAFCLSCVLSVGRAQPGRPVCGAFQRRAFGVFVHCFVFVYVLSPSIQTLGPNFSTSHGGDTRAGLGRASAAFLVSVCFFVETCIFWTPFSLEEATWLILPVVICLSQRLSHACLSINFYTVKLRMAH
jgi:hypothetical protein